MNKFIYLLCCLYSAVSWSDEVDCNNPISTLDMNYCTGIEVEAAEVKMNTYLAKSIERNSEDTELIKSINAAQKVWGLYAEAHCDSIYTQWREGTIRGVMYLTCKKHLTQQRTHDIWSNFLTYMDSTPAVLPEPIKP